MPVYNCELYVKEAIDSILNQIYTDFEIIIIDDASTDETVFIIKSYSDSRIRLLEKPVNTGYTDSLNQGLKLAKGIFIARMDGDDISLPERFVIQVSFLESNPDISVCGSCYKIIGNEEVKMLPEFHEDIKLALLRKNCIVHPSVMMRKQVLDKFDVVYDASKEPSEDYDLWVRFLLHGKIHNLQEVLINYRIYPSQVSQKRVFEQREKVIEVKFKLINNLGIVWDDDEHKVFKKILKKNSVINFMEIKIVKQIQKKLLQSNKSLHFFEHVGFEEYLLELEYISLKKYFYQQNRHSPLMYFKYLVAKCKWSIGVSMEQEIKFCFKSIFFWKVTKV